MFHPTMVMMTSNGFLEPNQEGDEPSEESDELSEEGDEPSEEDDVRHDNEQFQFEETKEELQTPRFPKRANRGIYGFHTHIKKAIEEFGDPGIKAIQIELKSMIEKNVWEPIHRSDLSLTEQKSIIKSLAFLKQKYKPDGTPDKVKARLVAGGHMQDETLSSDTSSPTVNITNVFMEASINAMRGMKCATADIGSAYLNAEMKENIFMKLHKHVSTILCDLFGEYKKYLNPDGTILVKLKKAQYGCKQSGLLWYKTMRESLLKLNFKVNDYDPCVEVKVKVKVRQKQIVDAI
jgi:hypothetical protein